MRILFFIFYCLFLLYCKPPAFSIARKDVSGDPIRMQGVYYNTPDFENLILYRNGIMLREIKPYPESIDVLKRNYSHYAGAFKSSPIFWGVFEIKNKQINIEQWYGCSEYCIFKYSGEILNDTMLLLNHPVVGKDTFFFHYIPVKPDSTNKFIK